MTQIVERLWELQTVLSQLAETERALSAKPEAYAEVERELREAETEIERLAARAEELGKQRRKLEVDLQDAQETLKKFQGTLMQVKNQQQYSAAWKEIETARKRVRDLEDGALSVMTELEEAQEALSSRQQTASGTRERHDREYEAWQSSLGDLREKAEKIRIRASDVESGIPDALRRQFHQILKQRQGVAMARVVGEACGECRVRLRAQSIQQLRRGEVVTCDGCRRFYYLEKVAS
ncbi:MAG TPA: hypothetical protein VMS56_00965 [Thermoanaerobaculia bacterium]|nr:hypothetical protein [Thermoanaerobaculia bacterium]